MKFVILDETHLLCCQMCDFMLADVADSERINRTIHEKIAAMQATQSTALPSPRCSSDALWVTWIHDYVARNKGSFLSKFDMRKSSERAAAIAAAKQLSQELPDGCYLSATIITRLCWPSLPEEDIIMPDRIQGIMNLYNDQYHMLKAPRRLTWKSNLGSVDIELNFEDRTLSLRVTPLQATLLALFEEQSDWSLDALQARLKLDGNVIEKGIAYLINQRVVEEERSADPEGHMYRVLETLPTVEAAEDDDVDMCAEDDCEDERGAAPQLDPQWEKIQSYVTGMLNVHGTASLDRIHNMLRMFVSDPAYDRSIDELREYLGSLVDKDVLDCANDVYSIHS